jgi:diguanylate cyclase (GGDEF)-like protein
VIRDEEHGNWFLPTGARPDQRDISVEDAGAEGLLPLSAFEYAERTEEALLVQDATRDDRFARDPYLAGAARCSLLVVPVRHSGALRAMLLLTNRETSGLFTTERLDALVLIAGQLVVSLNNALLYASLEQRVADRTRELGEANHKLEILSSTDALTNLPNRRQFEEMLNEQWHRADRVDRSFGLIMIDVDFFKTYNDEYGHQGGDECLRRVGAALAGVVRGATDLACRYGGEEFVVILGETDDTGAHVVAERVRTAVRALRIPHVAGVDGTLSVSVGVATAHVPLWESSDDLLARADAALYRAKEGGRNQVQIAPPAALSLPAGTGM